MGKPGTHNAGLLNGKEMSLVLVPRQTGAETVDVKWEGQEWSHRVWAPLDLDDR